MGPLLLVGSKAVRNVNRKHDCTSVTSRSQRGLCQTQHEQRKNSEPHAEDARSPLTDSRIADLLGEQGILVARRTIAKYREALQIPPVNLRKSP